MLLVETGIGPSGIHGTGLFAAKFIAKGTRIWEVTEGYDLKKTRAEIELLPEAQRRQMFTYSYTEMDTGLVVVCIDNDRHTNHSDNPNTKEFHEGSSVAYAIALRDIEEGEEITCDYRTFDAAWREKLGPDWPALRKRRERKLVTA